MGWVHLPGGGYMIDGPRDKTSVDEFEEATKPIQSIYKKTVR